PLVYRYGRRRGLQDADASDLTQDVPRAVSGGSGKLEYDPARGSFRGWLYALAQRKRAGPRPQAGPGARRQPPARRRARRLQPPLRGAGAEGVSRAWPRDLLGAALAVVALAFAATEALLWRPGATGANARKVRAGMTLVEDVEGSAETWPNGGGRWDRSVQ